MTGHARGKVMLACIDDTDAGAVYFAPICSASSSSARSAKARMLALRSLLPVRT